LIITYLIVDIPLVRKTSDEDIFADIIINNLIISKIIAVAKAECFTFKHFFFQYMENLGTNKPMASGV